MSIARALTVRLRRNGASSPSPTSPSTDDSSLMKRMASMVDRSKISSPVELISSTNMLSYDAPDVATIRQQRELASSAASTNSSSADDSDSSSTNDNTRSSHDLTDASSVEASPCEPNHLSCYFEAAQHESKHRGPASTSSTVRRSTSSANLKPGPLAPTVPRRALSHSKSSHIALARKRSLQSINSLSQRSSVREPTSPSSTSSPAAEHPFGKELEKLSEVVEELGSLMRASEDEDDAAVMHSQGLSSWTADQYLEELRPLYTTNFAGSNHPAGLVPAWI